MPSAGGDPAQREPVLVGQVDGRRRRRRRGETSPSSIDARARGSGRRRGGPGRGGRLRGAVGALGGDLLLLERQGDRLRAGRGAELRHRVAHVGADRLGREHQLLGDLGAAHALGEQRRGSRARAWSAAAAPPPGARDIRRPSLWSILRKRHHESLASATESTTPRFEVMDAGFPGIYRPQPVDGRCAGLRHSRGRSRHMQLVAHRFSPGHDAERGGKGRRGGAG